MVTICVPAYEAETFVAETLRSALAQTHREIRLVVSVDRSSDGTAAVCRGFEDDPRVRVEVQEERLGWVGNVNAAFDLADTEYSILLFHDDLLEEQYVERLLASAARDPQAVCHYGDVLFFGGRGGVSTADSMVGARGHRMLAQVLKQTGVPIRGLMSHRVLDAGVRPRDHGFGAFGPGEVWTLEVVALGDCVRVPAVRYHKSVSDFSVAATWRAIGGPQRSLAWIGVAREMLDVVEAAGLCEPEREQCIVGGLLRLASRVEGERLRGGLTAAPVEAQLPGLAGLMRERLGIETIADLVATPSAGRGRCADMAAEVLATQARHARRAGGQRAALKLLEQAAAVAPRSARARHRLADAASRADDHARAVALAHDAVELDATAAQARLTLARVLLRAGEQGAAVDAAEEGLARTDAEDAARERLQAVRDRALEARDRARP